MDQMSTKISGLPWQGVLDSQCSPLAHNVLFKIFNEIDLNTFTDITQTIKLVSYILNDKFSRACLEKWLTTNLKRFNSSKNANKSKVYREMGNEKFKNGDDKGSLDLYSKSVSSAPFDSEEFPLALANRSAALFRLEHFKECLQDVDLALKSGYPKHLKYKLLLRKGKLLMISKQCKQALQVFIDAEKSWPTKEKNSSIYEELLSTKKAAAENCNLKSSASTKEPVVPLPKLKKGESSEVEYMSAALSLKVNEEKNRYVVANTDINEGDILFVEKPYAFVVLPNQSQMNGANCCHNCCTEVIAPIPCESCVTAQYCSDECCKAAWDAFHRWECGGLELFFSVGIAHLGLRVALLYNAREVTQREIRLRSLMSHIKDMHRRDLYQYGFTASLLALFLQRKEYLAHKKMMLMELGGQIMLHICQLTCNGHAITKFVPQPTLSTCGVESQRQERAATAIYPSASMMNHSCEPNIINSFYNDHLVVRALKRIPAGGEVFNCYGPHYLRMNTKERKKSLKEQYFFTCDCQHCKIEGKGELLSTFKALLCLQCNGAVIPANKKYGICQQCKGKSPIDELSDKVSEANTLYDQAIAYLDAGNAIDAINLLLKCLPLLESSVYKYNRRLTECKDSLSQAFSMINKFSESRKYLVQCIPAVEKQFGTNSIEVGNEYVKLMTVYYNEAEQSQELAQQRKAEDECIKYGVKAQNIYQLYYGYWDKQCKNIMQNVALLQALEVWGSKRNSL